MGSLISGEFNICNHKNVGVKDFIIDVSDGLL